MDTDAGHRLLLSTAIADELNRWRRRLAARCALAPILITDHPPPSGIPSDAIRALLRERGITVSADGHVTWPANRIPHAGVLAARIFAAAPRTIDTPLAGMRRARPDRHGRVALEPPPPEALATYLRAQPWARATGVVITGVAAVDVGAPTADQVLIAALKQRRAARFTELRHGHVAARTPV